MSEQSHDTQVIKSVCMLCFMVCGIDGYVKKGELIKVEGMKDHAATKEALCPRGLHLPNYVYSPDRLMYPMMRDKSGSLERVTWEEALRVLRETMEYVKDTERLIKNSS